jgi:hypothetical protein
MIIKYREQSEEVEVHSDAHKVCTHELENGWECCCSDCECDAVISIQSRYAYDADRDHKVIIKVGGEWIALRPNVARELASKLAFAANDAETLNRDFPND